jgi:hypothetical protein
VTEFRVDMGQPPEQVLRQSPAVGEVYRKRGGPAGFLIIVSDNGSTFGHLTVDPDGRITGVGTGTDYYFRRRDLVGFVEEFPTLKIVWDDA